MYLRFSVESQHLTRTDRSIVVARSENYLKAKFDFSPDWDGVTKTAVFTNGGRVYNVILDNDECFVPTEVIRKGCFTVSVFGGDLITADVISIRVEPSGYEIGGSPEPPTPEVYEQLLGMFDKFRGVEEGQVLSKSSDEDLEFEWVEQTGGGGGGTTPRWGNIEGTLSDQTDLQAALNAKQNANDAFSGDYNDLTNKPTLFSGDYDDLTHKPEIPTIEANPTLSGTEAVLGGIKIDGTSYKVPGGGSGSSDDLTLKLIEASGINITNFADVAGLEYTTGKFISKNDGKTLQDYAYAKYTSVSVAKGEIYHIYTRSIGQTCMYSLLDSNGNALDWYPARTMPDGQRWEHKIVVIPDGAATMLVGIAYTYNVDGTPVIQKTTIDNVEFEVDHGGNVLYGKKWCSCGDSFTAGSNLTGEYTDKIAISDKTYPYLISERNHMNWVQLAVGGATFTNIEGAQFCFTDTTAGKNYTQIPSDCDYVTLSYGLNEGNLTDAQIGAKGDTTTETLWGAYDVVVKSILTANPTCKIGIIISDSWLTQKYHDELIDIAKYYMIPYLDLRNGIQVSCNINGRLDDCSADVKALRDNAFKVSANDAHPNGEAHKYRSTMIENFLRSL